MKKKEEYIDWKTLDCLMDEIYTIVEFDNEPKSEFSIISYLLKKTNLSKGASEKLAKQIIQSLKDERNEIGEIKKCIIFRKVFEFVDYKQWDKELYESTMLFREEFTLFPTIIIASKQTIARIDLIANNMNKENIKGNENQNPAHDEFASLGVFEADNFSLLFAIDSSIPEKKYILVFDSDPDWDDGGESKEEIKKNKKKKAA